MTRRNEWNLSVIRYMPKAPLSRPIAAILKSYWYDDAALIPPLKFNGLVLPNFKHGFDSFEAVPSHTTCEYFWPRPPHWIPSTFRMGPGRCTFRQEASFSSTPLVIISSAPFSTLTKLAYVHSQDAIMVIIHCLDALCLSIRFIENICSVILSTHSFWE